MHVKIHPIGEEQCVHCGIREQSLFRDLNSEDYRLIEHEPMHDLAIEPHAALFEEGTAGRYLYTIRSGAVKLVRFQADGSQRIIRLLSTGDVAGIECTDGGNYESTAIALTAVKACRISSHLIAKLESLSPRLHSQLVHKWHDALKQADDFIADLASGSARQRVARLLLRLSAGSPDQELMLPSREDVGAMLGITTETASRTVASFRREALIENLDRQGRHFRVDRAALSLIAARAD